MDEMTYYNNINVLILIYKIKCNCNKRPSSFFFFEGQHKKVILKCIWGTSLVVQWLRICLPMEGTRVRSLVWEDPTCHGATKLVHHNYWACALEPTSHNYWSPRAWSLCSATREATAMRSLCTTTKSSLLPHCSLQLDKAHMQQWRPNAAKKKKRKKKEQIALSPIKKIKIK